MSQYTMFYIRHGNDFIELDAFSRNSVVAQIVHEYAPWEKLAAVGSEELNGWINDVKEMIESERASIKRYEDDIQMISTWDNPVEEKMDEINWRRDEIESMRQDIEEDESALWFFRTLLGIEGNMISNARYEDHDPNWDRYYIYIGCETRCHPTIQDLVTPENATEEN